MHPITYVMSAKGVRFVLFVVYLSTAVKKNYLSLLHYYITCNLSLYFEPIELQKHCN